MSLLYFSDLLHRAGIEPTKVKLIRHAFTNEGFSTVREKKYDIGVHSPAKTRF